MLAAVTAATACVLDGRLPTPSPLSAGGGACTVSVEHPGGEFTVQLGLDPDDPTRVTKSALLRTARLIMAGDVMVPAHLWNHDPAPASAPKEQEL